MANKRREFAPEFKDEAVRLVINTGRPVAVVARELGIVEPVSYTHLTLPTIYSV